MKSILNFANCEYNIKKELHFWGSFFSKDIDNGGGKESSTNLCSPKDYIS